MALFQDPDSLQNLSFQALADYVCILCQDVIKIMDEDEVHLQEAQANCQRLKEFLHCWVPPALANQVTSDLLKMIAPWWNGIQLGSRGGTMLLDFIGALIHPAVTRLDLCPDDHPVFDIQLSFYNIIPFVCQRLDSVYKLKGLRLQHWRSLIVPLVSMQDLKEFTYRRGCSDEMLKVLSKSCKQLQKLDIKASNNVTNDSVQTLLQLQHLTHLEVTGTSISEIGNGELLRGLAEQGVRLQGFGCYKLTGNLLDELLRFTHLSSLKVSKVTNCSLRRLEGFKSLQSFITKSLNIEDMCDLLNGVGTQLLQLHFSCTSLLDPFFIAANCKTLSCLHIDCSNSCDFITPSQQLSVPGPGFGTVECLYLEIPHCPQIITWILTQCPNVKVLRINSMKYNSNILVTRIVKDIPLRHLEKLIWWPTDITRSSARRLIEHCPNLTVLLGRYVWKRYGSTTRLLDMISPVWGEAL